MRTAVLSSILAFLAVANAIPDEYSAFATPLTNGGPRPFQRQFSVGNGTSGNGTAQDCLIKRASCPTNYNSCSSLGSSDTCCPSDTNCSLDQAGNVACCPFSASCTGTIAGTATASGSVTSSTSSNFILGGTTTTTTPSVQTTPAGVAGGGSTVPNAAYPFVYIPTSYANSILCSSYYTSCQSESTSCLAALEGNGVTVAGVTTQQGASTTLPSASAASICSTLSLSACYNLQLSQCSNFGSGTAGTATTTASGLFQSAAARPRITGCSKMMYAMGAGAVFGAAGVLV